MGTKLGTAKVKILKSGRHIHFFEVSPAQDKFWFRLVDVISSYASSLQFYCIYLFIYLFFFLIIVILIRQLNL